MRGLLENRNFTVCSSVTSEKIVFKTVAVDLDYEDLDYVRV